MRRPDLADSFDPSASNEVFAIAVQADGKILAGGGFTMLAPNGGATVTRNRIARLETDGRADQTLDLNLGTFPNSVYVSAVQPDGKILIGGRFPTVLGVARNNIARLNTDGTLDAGFQPERERHCLCHRGAGGRKDPGGRTVHGLSADRRATASPGSIPPLAWLIRSTRTRSE